MSSLADSMSHMSDSIVELRQAPSATAKRDSRAVELNSPACDRQKRRKAQLSDNEGSDVDALINDSAGDKAIESEKGDEGEEDDLLTSLALEYSADDKSCGLVSTQLADIVNKRWSSKLLDDKFKEKTAKYG